MPCFFCSVQERFLYMKTFIGMFAVLALSVVPAVAQDRGHDQHEQHGGVGGGYVPPHGPPAGHQQQPPPAVHQQPQGRVENRGDNRGVRDHEGHPEAPHVHSNGEWVGHDFPRGDARFHLDHPWEHGRWSFGFGPSHVWRVERHDRDRFWINGYAFVVAPFDLGYVGNWMWDSDQVVLYDDPEDPGYYLAYNPRTGTYVHVILMGR